MISKETAMHIYNLHSQIERTNEVLVKLNEVKDKQEKDQLGIDILPSNWGNGSVQLSIPERFFNNKACDYSSMRIYQISIADAILVLENHKTRLNTALEITNNNIANEKDNVQ